MFEPVKRWLQEGQHAIIYRGDQDFIAGFFDGKARLMLGNLISGFNQAFHHGGEVTHPQNADYLRQNLPHYQPDAETQQRRREQLDRLPTIRNRQHNSPNVSKTEIEAMINTLYRHPQDGLYRYLLGA
ncbi:MAG: hypothetical protein R3E08_13075 [Thiotrichaceae bacterium]